MCPAKTYGLTGCFGKEAKIASLREQLAIHEANLAKLEKQRALDGGDPSVKTLNAIEHEQEEITRIKRELDELDSPKISSLAEQLGLLLADRDDIEAVQIVQIYFRDAAP